MYVLWCSAHAGDGREGEATMFSHTGYIVVVSLVLVGERALVRAVLHVILLLSGIVVPLVEATNRTQGSVSAFLASQAADDLWRAVL